MLTGQNVWVNNQQFYYKNYYNLYNYNKDFKNASLLCMNTAYF